MGVMEANLEVFAEKLDRFRRYDGAEQPCHAVRFLHSLTEKARTLPKPFGCFGWVRLEIGLV